MDHGLHPWRCRADNLVVPYPHPTMNRIIARSVDATCTWKCQTLMDTASIAPNCALFAALRYIRKNKDTTAGCWHSGVDRRGRWRWRCSGWCQGWRTNNTVSEMLQKACTEERTSKTFTRFENGDDSIVINMTILTLRWRRDLPYPEERTTAKCDFYIIIVKFASRSSEARLL